MAWVKKYKQDGFTEDGWMEVPDDQAAASGGDFAKVQAAQRAWQEQQARRWGIADKAAYAVAAIPFGAAAASALGGGAGGSAASSGTSAGGAAMPAAATEGMAFDAAPLAGGGGGGLGGVLSGLSARDWAALAASGIGTVGGLMSNKPLQAPTSATTDPNMQKLLATMQGRLDQSEPLYKSIMAMANGLLPTQYQNGGAGR